MNSKSRVVVAVGGYRTGSTLQYNLLGQYLEESSQGRRIGLVDPDDVDEVLSRELALDAGVLVTKCHHLATGFGDFRNPTAWQDYIESGVAVPLSTARQSAEVERSISIKFGIPIENLHDTMLWKQDKANRRAWAEFAPFEQKYEDLTQRPVDALRAAVDELGFHWDPEAAVRAAHGSDLNAALRVISTVEEGTYDQVSLLHWNHISSETRTERLATD
jgi:hypothetical protein